MPSLAPNTRDERKTIAVCGGGLAGCLAACYFAKKNFDVMLFELRDDIRTMKVVAGRSINMAMSLRGREALKLIGAEEAITSKGIEMHSRMLHDMKGQTKGVQYGKKSQSILSIDRRYLNELLLAEAEKYPNIKIFFNHKIIKCDTNTGECHFQNTVTNENVSYKSDLIVGCDGAYSRVRQSLLKDQPVNYTQEYISSYYLELNIPPNAQGDFAMPTNYLHIWPRGDFMLIALPNQDRSFTCTLFMPNEIFKKLVYPTQILDFFKKYFVDALDLIGRDNILDAFNVKPSPLMYVKCDPHHGEKCVLIGDAAHAVVPFYGQGMNCAFEDLIVFFEILDKYGFQNLDIVLEKYSEKRVPDAHAICDLALTNYTEMRYLVTTKKYMIRKYLDNILHKFFPNYWIPLYTMVTFTRIRYSDVIKKRELQDKIISNIGTISLATGLLALSGLAIYKYRPNTFKSFA